MNIVKLPTAKIFTRLCARPIDKNTVRSLASSIAEVGLINPLRVRSVRRIIGGVDADAYEVTTGGHRLSAVVHLGWETVSCHLIEEDDLHAELATIDENLMRADLDPAQRAKQTARRKAIYVELHPETAHGENQHTRSRQLGDSSERFTADTSASTGKSERAVQRDAERGENIAPDVLDTISGTKGLNTGAYLDKVKKISDPDAQRAKVERDIANDEKRKASEARARRAARVDADVVNRAAKELAELIVAHFPSDVLDSVKANLYVAKARNVADALANLLGQSIIDRSAEASKAERAA